MGSFSSHDSSIRVISKVCKILHSSMHFQSTRPMHAFARSFARRMFSGTSETRAGAFIFSRCRTRARAFHFLKPFFDFVSFVSVEHTHPATMMDFIQIETRSSFAHRRVVTLQNRQIGLGLGSSRGLGLGLGLAWIHFFLHFGARVIHPYIHPSIARHASREERRRRCRR